MKFVRRLVTTAACALLLLSAGCGKDSTKPGQQEPPVPSGRNVSLQWTDVLLQALKDTKPGPPAAARAIAIVETCMYDAWAPYDAVANGTRFGGEMRRPESERTDGFKSKAMSYAAYRALLDLFRGDAQKAQFRALMTTLGYDPDDASTDHETPQGLGNACAAAVIAFRHVDGSNQLGDLSAVGTPYSDYTGYVARNPAMDPTVPTPLSGITDPDHWQPLTHSLTAGAAKVTPPYAQPQWGHMIPFAMSDPAQFRPAGPAVYGTDAYRVQCQEILDISANLNDSTKVTAEFWADGPGTVQPPGHWTQFAQFVSERDHHTLDQDAKMLFAVGNALMDAGIAVWDAKRAYDSVRPMTAIRYQFNGQTVRAWAGPGQGAREIDGAAWHTYQTEFFPTPPFPEFPSGHSGFSASSAEILKRFTGSDNFGYQFTVIAGSLKVEPGVVPARDMIWTMSTFSQAADYAGISRRYGGIHFKDGDLASRRIGRQVGAVVWEKAQSFWNGTAQPFRLVAEVQR